MADSMCYPCPALWTSGLSSSSMATSVLITDFPWHVFLSIDSLLEMCNWSMVSSPLGSSFRCVLYIFKNFTFHSVGKCVYLALYILPHSQVLEHLRFDSIFTISHILVILFRLETFYQPSRITPGGVYGPLGVIENISDGTSRGLGYYFLTATSGSCSLKSTGKSWRWQSHQINSHKRRAMTAVPSSLSLFYAVIIPT